MLCSVVSYLELLHDVQCCYMVPRFITCCAVLLRVISSVVFVVTCCIVLLHCAAVLYVVMYSSMLCSVVTCYQEC